MTTTADHPEASNRTLNRIEVRAKPGFPDAHADQLLRDAAALNIHPTSARTTRVYLIDAPLTPEQRAAIIRELLASPVADDATPNAAPTEDGARLIEVHPLPGVMDPPGETLSRAIKELLDIDAPCSTGTRYDIAGITDDEASTLATRLLANETVQRVHFEPFHPESLPVGHETEFRLTHIPIRDLDDAGLEKLSREGHLFLSLTEMQAIQAEYNELGREPTEIELETLAQTWSEHCVHKTLKSTVTYRAGNDHADPIDWTNRPGHEVHPDGSVTIHNLLKSTVAAATHELIADGVDWCLSVFVDNAGIIALDDDHAVCIKVETHNHPSAIEPYGGSATGIGGCIRDIMGTGLMAKPIASTDVFCVAPPDLDSIPEGCLRPRRILSRVVAGIRDYGNRMGIPTVNGAVWFDERHVGNPLVFAGCIGLLPRELAHGDPKPGDRIIAIGGRTGRDGIHGATFSSAELTDTHADEFSHAVQIGHPVEQRRVMDALLRARDAEGGPLFNAITDCGAGGFSSAVGEMGEKIGANVHLENAPLKYAGLTSTEIWISEAQERMVLAVPPEKLEELRQICADEHTELADLGEFGTPDAELILNFHEHEVGRLPMHFLHDGIPMPTREAVWTSPERNPSPTSTDAPGTADALKTLLAQPNIASKHWIIRQYDHEVQGNTVVKPLVGSMGRGPGDASVIEPVPGSGRGIAVGCGLATGLEADPYLMALAAIDEAVRNTVCVGADPRRTAILDNFCWPSCGKPENLASLVRACEGCYDAAKAYRTPFVSGKDSLNNQFTTADGRTIEIPPTLLITALGVVHDLRRAMTMDIKRSGSTVYLIEPIGDIASGNRTTLAGSHYARAFGVGADHPLPMVDLNAGPALAAALADSIAEGHVRAAHDLSDGGALVALAEMLIAGSTPAHPIGASLRVDTNAALLFGERPSSYLCEIASDHTHEFEAGLAGVATLTPLADTTPTGVLEVDGATLSVEELATIWSTPLDW